MDRQRWLQIEDLLQQTLDVQPHERAAFLTQACDGDAVLFSEVEALLKREEQAGSFMESPAIASLPRVEPPSQISHYQIEKHIGSGGMGEVFKAHDETLRRVVALKMLPVEFTSDTEHVRRFEQEALAASRLNHPNIITIFEIVEAGEAQFIVEEFIEGRTLRELLRDSQPLELDRALDIAIQIARALKAAHTAWIIHRDIKPENVMVREDGLVKVLDFGIAKLGEEGDDVSSAVFQSHEPSLTVPGMIMGTASYMSPEQARGEPLDGRTDLFSLGLVIYEMVTGLPPAPDVKFDQIPKGLQRIVRRALRTDRNERYASASELLDDLTRLKGRRETRATRRLVGLSALALVVALAIVGIAGFLSVQETWDETVVRDGHSAAVRRAVFSPDGKLLVSVGEDHRVIVWDFARRMPVATLTEHTAPVVALTFSPDGKWFVTGGQDHAAVLWNASTLKKELAWHDQRGPIYTASFSPDSKLLAYATDKSLTIRETKSWSKLREIPGGIGQYGTYVFLDNSQFIADSHGNVWEIASDQQQTVQPEEFTGNWVALSPDAKRWAAIDPLGYVKVVDLVNRKLAYTQRAHHDHGRAIAYSPDGKLIASASERVLLWDASALTKIAPLEYESIVWSVAFSPDGRWLVSTHGDGSILIWDVINRELDANLRQHSGGVRALALTPDGKQLATGSEDQSVILWDVESGRKVSVLTEHQTRVTAVAFSPDGSWLASSALRGAVIKHNLAQNVSRRAAGVKEQYSSYFLAVSPDGRFIATSFAIYNADSGEVVAGVGNGWGNVYSAAFTNDGARLIGVTDYGHVLVLDARSWQVVERQRWTTSPLVTMSLSPDGTHIVTGDDGKTIRLGTVNPLRQTAVIGQHSARVKAVVFSPDGKQVASAGDDKMVALWDVNSRKLVTTIGTHTSPIYALAFSADGKRLFTGEHDRSVRRYTRRRSLWGFSLD